MLVAEVRACETTMPYAYCPMTSASLSENTPEASLAARVGTRGSAEDARPYPILSRVSTVSAAISGRYSRYRLDAAADGT